MFVGSNVSKRLSFKPRVYLLEGGQLAAYSLGTGQVSEVVQLPQRGTSKQGLSARCLVCSQKADACLIFFLAISPAGVTVLPSPSGHFVFLLIFFSSRASLARGLHLLFF